jgi:hypothetical protein
MSFLKTEITSCLSTNNTIEYTLQKLKDLRSLYSSFVFRAYVYDILINSSIYGKLPIIIWLWSIDNNYESKWFYETVLIKSSEYHQFHIIQHLFDNAPKTKKFIEHKKYIHKTVFKNIFYNTGHIAWINNNKTIETFNYLYDLFKTDINITTFNSMFKWACDTYIEVQFDEDEYDEYIEYNNKLLSRINWIMLKKPYHYELIMDDTKTKILKYKIIPEKERIWNSVKTILFLSQVKNSSMLYKISNDVVKDIICPFIVEKDIT